MITREEMMLRCLRLAEKGMGGVSPNPLVGCVIVKNGQIIGEGFHEKFGGPHAEVNAIRSASVPVEDSEVFVNLEPCSYFGKTPPCADLLVENKVKKVYVAMLDPNPKVNGNGVGKLRSAGIEVEVGLLAEESLRLNEVFVKYITKGLPFVTLKVAQSLDGRIALTNGISKYITSKDSLERVHVFRAQHDAVLVGAGTIAADDPSLTVRLVDGKSPVRIILDGNLTSPVGSGIFHDKKSRVVLFHAAAAGERSGRKASALRKLGVELYGLRGNARGRIRVKTVLERIAAMGIASVLVEGGTGVFSEFIRAGMADKLHLFVAPTIIGNGQGFADGINLKSLKNAVRLKDIQISRVGSEQLVTGYF
jgi:diaminohydroxyphosphoribosylaminopyrimidine deaminase / 5-amino-6-(5-phosphoribosylamino)uracil reductase